MTDQTLAEYLLEKHKGVTIPVRVGWFRWMEQIDCEDGETRYRDMGQSFILLPNGGARITRSQYRRTGEWVEETKYCPPGTWSAFLPPTNNFGSKGGIWIEKNSSTSS
jgi:hypothetical protein